MKLDSTTLTLPSTQYFVEEHVKKQIFVHHTVGGSAQATYEWWLKDTSVTGEVLKVATAFILERDGTVYQTFDPKYWAYHLGLKSSYNLSMNQQSIGIEIASEGGLVKKSDGILYAFDGHQVFRDEYIELSTPWRGFQYFDSYSPAQTLALYALIKNLCEQFNIPKVVLPKDLRWTANLEEISKFSGILGHADVRLDKSDPHPKFSFDYLQKYLLGTDPGQALPTAIG